MTAESLDRMSATYNARCSATDPDGDLAQVALSGDALATGTSYAQTKVTFPRLEGFVAKVMCTALDATGLATTEEVVVDVPSPDRPPLPAYYDFFIRELANSRERVEGGTLEMRLNGRDTLLVDDDGDGWIRLWWVLPQTVQLRYSDSRHNNSMQVLREDIAPGPRYGARRAANWSAARMSFTLPEGGGGYLLYAADDAFDRELYKHVKTGDGGPLRMLCEDFDPSGWDDQLLDITFWYDDAAAEQQDSLLLSEIALKQQLSGNTRFSLTRHSVFTAPAGPAVHVTRMGQASVSYGSDGCVDAVTYVPPDMVSVAEATRVLGQMLFFPVWDDALFEDGAFTDFAREVLSADAAIGPDPAYFTR